MSALDYTLQCPRAKVSLARQLHRALSGRATVGPGGTLEGRGQYAGASRRYRRARGGKLGRSLARAIGCREVGPRYVPYSRKTREGSTLSSLTSKRLAVSATCRGVWVSSYAAPAVSIEGASAKNKRVETTRTEVITSRSRPAIA